MPTRSRRSRIAGTDAQAPSSKRLKQTAAQWLGTEEDAFDLWLRQSLHEAFGAITEEPVPEDILRMINEDHAEREFIRHSQQAKRKG
jgi:hypothetical protein